MQRLENLSDDTSDIDLKGSLWLQAQERCISLIHPAKTIKSKDKN